MKSPSQLTAAVPLLIFLMLLATTACRKEERKLAFGGGPTGGTFQLVAAGIAAVLEQTVPGTKIVVRRSGGSLANLKEVERGELDMALLYSGDAFLGERGMLDQNLPPTRNVQILAAVYGAAAQLAVLQNSRITTPLDLKGLRVAIGNPGSGSALAAERFFRQLGIWEELIPIYAGYDSVERELVSERVAAAWDVVGPPSASLTAMSRRIPLRLLDLQASALSSGLFEKFPFYTATVIPANTYPRQTQDVPTFQDAALWVAGTGLDASFVYQALDRVFSEEGLVRLTEAHPALSRLKAAVARPGLPLRLHPGAERFWRERDLTIRPRD